jgi:hypothetical protein
LAGLTLHGRNVGEITLQCLLCLHFYWQALRVNLARLTSPARTLGEPTLQGLLCKSYLARSQSWQAHNMRGLLCEACSMCVKLGDANSARLTLCVLRPLQSFMLNLAKLCKADFAHRKCQRAYFAGLYFARLLCTVEMLESLLCSACFVYIPIGRR